jgi:uncharacterized Fe-S cluster-containing protein
LITKNPGNDNNLNNSVKNTMNNSTNTKNEIDQKAPFYDNSALLTNLNETIKKQNELIERLLKKENENFVENKKKMETLLEEQSKVKKNSKQKVTVFILFFFSTKPQF